MAPSPAPSPLWPAALHHLALLSADADRLAGFLGVALQMRCERSEGGGSILAGPGRRIAIWPGATSGALHLGYALDDPERVAELRSRFAHRGVRTDPTDAPFFRTGSFRVAAPSPLASLPLQTPREMFGRFACPAGAIPTRVNRVPRLAPHGVVPTVAGGRRCRGTPTRCVRRGRR